LSPKIVKEHREPGLCPRCDAPIDYVYRIEGPLEPDRELARIIVRIECPVCGYRDEKKILFPVKGLNMIKYLFLPEIRPVIEKLYHLYKIRVIAPEIVESEGSEND